jgi:hypothetical protein
MSEFEIRSRDRHCSASGVELGPGMTIYSALIQKETGVIRQDYAAQAWKEPPEHCIGWWKSKIPDKKTNRVYWAPNEVILNYFQQLQGEAEQADVLYLLSLLMIRKRLLKFEDVHADEDHPTEVSQSAQETLHVIDPRDDSEYHIPVVTPDKDQIAALEQRLCELLFSDEPPEIENEKQAVDDLLA